MAATAATRAIPFNLPFPAGVQLPTQELTDSGAITIPCGCVVLNKAGVITATLAAPTVNGLFLFISSETAQAHKLDLASSGVSGHASNDVGTFGGAAADCVGLFSYDGHWYQFSNVNVTWSTT
jgi:hypothetical protein